MEEEWHPVALDRAESYGVCFTRDWMDVKPHTPGIVIGPEDGVVPEGVWSAIRAANPRAQMNMWIRLWLAQSGLSVNDVGIARTAVITDAVTIGEHVYIGSGCVIGEPGFAYDMIDGEWRRFPQIGRVIIGDNVEIEAMCHIARGSLHDTVIRDGVKMDACCHIAHNCDIGEQTLIAAGVTLSGSVIVGQRVWLGTQCTVRDGITIGDDVCVGVGAVIVKDVPAGVTVMGNPARIKE